MFSKYRKKRTIENTDRIENKYLPNNEIMVEGIDEDANELTVYIKMLNSKTDYGWREKWNLAHTRAAIKSGEYKLIKTLE